MLSKKQKNSIIFSVIGLITSVFLLTTGICALFNFNKYSYVNDINLVSVSGEFSLDCTITKNGTTDSVTKKDLEIFFPGDYIEYNVTIHTYPMYEKYFSVGIVNPVGTVFTQGEITYAFSGDQAMYEATKTNSMSDMYTFSLTKLTVLPPGGAEEDIFPQDELPANVPIGPSAVDKFVKIAEIPALGGAISFTLQISFSPLAGISLDQTNALLNKSFGYSGLVLRAH